MPGLVESQRVEYSGPGGHGLNDFARLVRDVAVEYGIPGISKTISPYRQDYVEYTTTREGRAFINRLGKHPMTQTAGLMLIANHIALHPVDSKDGEIIQRTIQRASELAGEDLILVSPRQLVEKALLDLAYR